MFSVGIERDQWHEKGLNIFKLTLNWLGNLSMLTFTCSKLTTETIEKSVKYVPATSMKLFWCFYFEFWTYFTPFSGVSIVNFEQVNVSWDVLNRFKVNNKTVERCGTMSFTIFLLVSSNIFKTLNVYSLAGDVGGFIGRNLEISEY